MSLTILLFQSSLIFFPVVFSFSLRPLSSFFLFSPVKRYQAKKRYILTQQKGEIILGLSKDSLSADAQWPRNYLAGFRIQKIRAQALTVSLSDVFGKETQKSHSASLHPAASISASKLSGTIERILGGYASNDSKL